MTWDGSVTPMDLYILCPKHRKTRPKQSILTTSKGFSDAFDHLTCQAGSTWQWDTFFFHAVIGCTPTWKGEVYWSQLLSFQQHRKNM